MKLRPGNMKATFKIDPFPHVLLEDFYTKGEMRTVLEEKRKLDPHLLPPGMTGSATHQETGRPMKFNNGLFLSHAIPNSEIISLSRRHIFHELVDQIDCSWWNEVWKKNNTESWMLSRYTHGQYYNAHCDMSQHTMLVWFNEEPKQFTGGDLIFTDYNLTIPCVNNTGIIFPGPLRHEVPPVSGTGRYCLTLFTGLMGQTK